MLVILACSILFVGRERQRRLDRKFGRALTQGDHEAMRKWLAVGASPDLTTPASLTALWLALAGDESLTKVFLAKGFDPNLADQWGSTVLIQASARNSPEVVRALLATRAKPNQQDAGGFTALMYGARSDSDELVRLLLKAGANPNVQDRHGSTVLMWAARYGNGGAVRRLLQSGADPHLLNADHRSALDIAASEHHVEIYRVLRTVSREGLDAAE